MKPIPTWHDTSDPPTDPGIYYWETCDDFGNPCPGLYHWPEGEPPRFPTERLFKMFGPIPGAFKLWEMVPVADEPINVASPP